VPCHEYRGPLNMEQYFNMKQIQSQNKKKAEGKWSEMKKF